MRTRIDVIVQGPYLRRQFRPHAVDVCHELTEVGQLQGIDLGEHGLQIDNACAEHQADVGDVVLVISRERMIPRSVEHCVYLQELVVLEHRSDGLTQSRVDGREARPVDGFVVAAPGAQSGLVDVDDRDGAPVNAGALGLRPFQEIGQSRPPIRLVKPVLSGDLQRLISFGPDEAPSRPTGECA